MTKDEALKLALEALERATRYGAGGFEDVKDSIKQALAAQPAATMTDEQILAANYPDGEENGATIAAPDVELIAFARAIEAKLKEKNRG